VSGENENRYEFHNKKVMYWRDKAGVVPRVHYVSSHDEIWGSGIHFRTFFPLREEQRIAYPLNRRLGWAQSLSCSFVEEKNLLTPPRNEVQFIGRPVRNLFTAATEVSTLLIGLTETSEFASQTETLTMRISIRLADKYRRLN